MTPEELQKAIDAVLAYSLRVSLSTTDNKLGVLTNTASRRSHFKSGELAGAAACYIIDSLRIGNRDLKALADKAGASLWPFAKHYRKNFDDLRDIILEAIVLLLCEWDRLDNIGTSAALEVKNVDTFGNPIDTFGFAIAEDLKAAETANRQETLAYIKSYGEVFGTTEPASILLSRLEQFYPHRSAVIAEAELRRQRRERIAELERETEIAKRKLFEVVSPPNPGGVLQALPVGPGVFLHPFRVGGANSEDLQIAKDSAGRIVRSEGIDKIVG